LRITVFLSQTVDLAATALEAVDAFDKALEAAADPAVAFDKAFDTFEVASDAEAAAAVALLTASEAASLTAPA